MFCTNCGHELPTEGKFCPYCGVALNKNGVEVESSPFSEQTASFPEADLNKTITTGRLTCDSTENDRSQKLTNFKSLNTLIGTLIAISGFLGTLYIQAQIESDYFWYTYEPPYTNHELTMLSLKYLCIAIIIVGLFVILKSLLFSRYRTSDENDENEYVGYGTEEDRDEFTRIIEADEGYQDALKKSEQKRNERAARK